MILVVGHKNPDSDSICSALVATELLKARGVEAMPIRQAKSTVKLSTFLK